MGPLPLVTALFLLGLALGAQRDFGALAWPCLACALWLFARATTKGTLGRGGPYAALAAAFALGLARGASVPALVTRGAATLARAEAGLLEGRVEEGCDEAQRTEDGLRAVRCVLSRDGDGARVSVRVQAVDPGAAPGCAAREGDRIELVATVAHRAPESNGAREGPGAASHARGVQLRASASGCLVLAGPRWWDARARWLRAGAWLRARLGAGIERAFPSASGARARALLFGDEQGLAREELDAFRDTGLSHLLAVSGAHVALVTTALGWALARCARRSEALSLGAHTRVALVLLPLPAVAVFVASTGASASAVRALVSGALGAWAACAGRRPHGESLVALSAALTACAEPGSLYDPGWQLSVTAGWALAVQSPVETQVEPRARRDGYAARAVSSVARTVSAGLRSSVRVAAVVAPVVLWHFRRVPLAAVCANALCAPLAEVFALPSVLLAALVGCVAPSVAPVLCAPLARGLDLLFALPALAMRLPLASTEAPPPTPAQAACALAIALFALRFSRRMRFACALFALCVVGLLEARHRARVRPTGVLRVTALDVGQGDALLIDLPDGEAMLVDAGGALFAGGDPERDPGARIVVPVLADRRRRNLALVVASHPHPDHIGGLPAVLSWARVGSLWDTRQGERPAHESAAYVALRAAARARGVTVRGPDEVCGAPRSFHGATLEVLAPCPGVRAGDGPNDASFVLRISHGATSVLLPGDLEARGERALLARGEHLERVTLLKLGHHGSRTSSTPAWLDALAPRVALVSSGHPSPFGHPHAVVRARLEARGITLGSTARDGAVAVVLYPDGRWAMRAGAELDQW